MKKKIGIIGSGEVSQALADGFLKYGCEVLMGSRQPGKLAQWEATAGEKGKIGTFVDAASFGEILILAVKGSAASEALRLSGRENLKDKTIIDATNPIADLPPENGVLRFFTDLQQSLMEQLQAEYKEAHFVKAFNSVGNALMVNPDFHGLKPTMFICGNNQQAKNEVREILDLFGFETLLHGAGIKVSFDTGWDPRGFQKKEVEPLFDILPKVDVFLPNIDEARKILGDDSLTPDGAARIFLDMGVKVVVIKMGKLGCYVTDGQFAGFVPAFNVKVVDTTGAGDTFMAGLLSAYVNGKILHDCAVIGAATAGIKVGGVGWSTYPTRDAVNRFLQENYNNNPANPPLQL
jgi:predicted dinucleotide-binding enzyme